MNTIDTTYMDEDSAASIEGLPEEAWPALVEACEELTGGDEPGVDCEVAKTHDTLDSFEEAREEHWSEQGVRREFTFDGRPAVLYERLQIMKGAARRDMIVVDLGDCRAVLS